MCSITGGTSATPCKCSPYICQGHPQVLSTWRDSTLRCSLLSLTFTWFKREWSFEWLYPHLWWITKEKKKQKRFYLELEDEIRILSSWSKDSLQSGCNTSSLSIPLASALCQVLLECRLTKVPNIMSHPLVHSDLWSCPNYTENGQEHTTNW